jgi:hypothetical protein
MGVNMTEVTLKFTTNKPDNPYIRLHMIIDLLENAPDDYVVDKEWIEAELREIFQMFYHIGWEKYADGKPC